MLKVLFVFFCFLISGCFSSTNEKYNKENYIIKEAINNSKNQMSKFDSYLYLKKFYIKTFLIKDNKDDFFYTFNKNKKGDIFICYKRLLNNLCKEMKDSKELYNLMFVSLDASLKENNISAYNELYTLDIDSIFSKNKILFEDFNNLKKSYIPNLLKLNNNSEISMVLALLYTEGFYVVKNYSIANDYYKKAYSFGNISSAAFIAHNYYSIGDYENSLFWSLRCTFACSEFFLKNRYFNDYIKTNSVKLYDYDSYNDKIEPNKIKIIEKDSSNINKINFL